MDRVEVVIDQQANLISVFNTSDGIPVELHKEEGVFVPELIFGHLLTSSNYDDMEKKTTGGRNGYGAKLTNIFSTEFVIETADGKHQLKYKQVSFINNKNTIKCGTNVDYITGQTTKLIIDIVKKKNKIVSLKPHIVKKHLWVFVNALIDNHAFNSQTKETLTTWTNSFGTTLVHSSGVVESFLSWAEFKQNKDLKKTDGQRCGIFLVSQS